MCGVWYIPAMQLQLALRNMSNISDAACAGDVGHLVVLCRCGRQHNAWANNQDRTVVML